MSQLLNYTPSIDLGYGTLSEAIIPVPSEGLIDYYDAASRRTDSGGKTNQWRAILGTRGIQATSGNQPSYVDPALEFGDAEYFSTDLYAPTTGLLGIYYKKGVSPASASRAIIGAADSTTFRLQIQETTTGRGSFLIGSASISSVALAMTPDTSYTLIMRWDGSTAHVYINGVEAGSGTGYTDGVPTRPLAIGARYNSDGNYDQYSHGGGNVAKLREFCLIDGSVATVDASLVAAVHAGLSA